MSGRVLVLQPDGKLALFCTTSDQLTAIDLTVDQARAALLAEALSFAEQNFGGWWARLVDRVTTGAGSYDFAECVQQTLVHAQPAEQSFVDRARAIMEAGGDKSATEV